MLKSNERLDKLIKENLEIIQSDDVFSFSTDALLLAHFTHVKRKDRVMDLCSGNGIIPLLLSHKSTAMIDAIEIQDVLVDMAERTIIHNHLENQIKLYHMDLKEVTKHFVPSTYSVVTCNPPYFRDNQNFKHQLDTHMIARHEVLCDIDDCCQSAKHLLKQGGKLMIVQRADRLVDVLCAMRLARIEPKKIYPIYAKHDKPQAITVVVEGVKGGKQDVKMMPPFYIYDGDDYSKEMLEVYYGAQ